MDKVAAKIYIMLSVATVILFILTRRVHIRIRKSETTVFSIGFSLFKIEFTKNAEKSLEAKPLEENSESEVYVDFGDILSLLTTLLHYFQKCTVTIRRLAIPVLKNNNGMYRFFVFKAIESMSFAYIESNVEKLIISDNAFILSSDEKFKFDIDLGIILFDLIILTLRLIIKGLKIGWLEKSNVGN